MNISWRSLFVWGGFVPAGMLGLVSPEAMASSAPAIDAPAIEMRGFESDATLVNSSDKPSDKQQDHLTTPVHPRLSPFQLPVESAQGLLELEPESHREWSTVVPVEWDTNLSIAITEIESVNDVVDVATEDSLLNDWLPTHEAVADHDAPDGVPDGATY